ncbi:MAG: helix-turn-helix transcriptional regulator [Planctomycetes bacterium]|nr:helix-turn-helix transcriptional regulator [Planctomycetota bacterium]
MSFGTELKKARTLAGLSQEKLAFEAEVDRTYISLLERGKKCPTLEVYFRICRALKMSPTTMMARLEKSLR